MTLAVVTTGVNVATHSLQTSPLDELDYIHYTDKVLSQGFVRLNEQVGDYTVQILSCEGVIPNVTYGECGDASAEDLPYSGHTQAAPYTPLFFGLTAIVGGGIHLLTGVERLVAWRLVGAFWLAGAMLMMVLAFRRWKIPDTTTFVLGLLVITSPYTWLAETFLSTDAPALFVGASLLYMVTKVRNRELSPKWLLLAFPFAVALKVTNISAILLSLLFLFIAAITDARNRHLSEGNQPRVKVTVNVLVTATLGLVLAGVLEFIWLKFVAASALPAVVDMDQGVSRNLSGLELITQATNFISATITANPLLTSKYAPFFAPLSWLSIAGVVGGFLSIRKWDAYAEMKTAVLLAAVLAAPVLALTLQIGTGSYFSIEPRYGGSLIPAFMLSTAFILKNRMSLILLTLYAIACLGVGLAFSIRLH